MSGQHGHVRYRYVFKNFHYNECDDFASWLEEMAAEGWILESWPHSLKFRQGVPQKIHCAVDVFPGGDEGDLRPSPETEEFAEYCRAAGWELVDARQKFCIFRQIREDPPAVPIVTEEERFQNVSKAEGKSCLSLLVPSLLTAALWIAGSLTTGFPMSFFSDPLPGLLCCWVFTAVWYLIRFVRFLVWRQRTGKRLRRGEKVFYGNHRSTHRPGRWVGSLLLIVYLISIMGMTEELLPYVPVVIITAVCMAALCGLIAALRPLHETNTALSVAVPMILMIVMIPAIYGVSAAHPEQQTLSSYPILPSDYAGVRKEDITGSSITRTRSMLGRMTIASLSYREDSTSGLVSYTICESPCTLLLDAVWDRMEERYSGRGKAADQTALWGAERAYMIQSGDFRYLVQYPGMFMLLTETDPLSQEEIAAIHRTVSADASDES